MFLFYYRKASSPHISGAHQWKQHRLTDPPRKAESAAGTRLELKWTWAQYRGREINPGVKYRALWVHIVTSALLTVTPVWYSEAWRKKFTVGVSRLRDNWARAQKEPSSGHRLLSHQETTNTRGIWQNTGRTKDSNTLTLASKALSQTQPNSLMDSISHHSLLSSLHCSLAGLLVTPTCPILVPPITSTWNTLSSPREAQEQLLHCTCLCSNATSSERPYLTPLLI